MKKGDQERHYGEVDKEVKKPPAYAFWRKSIAGRGNSRGKALRYF